MGCGVGRRGREIVGDVVAMICGEIDVYVVLVVGLWCRIVSIMSVFVWGRRSYRGVLWGRVLSIVVEGVWCGVGGWSRSVC